MKGNEAMSLEELETFVEEVVKRQSEIVNLSHRGLTILTRCVEKMTCARHLTLNDNQLLMPPSELSSLTRLEELVLDNNRLTMLPQGIGSLCNLRYYYI